MKRIIPGLAAAVILLVTLVAFQNCGKLKSQSFSNLTSSGTPVLDPNSQTPQDPYIDRVVLLMHMTGSSGATTFADSTGRHPNATVKGNAQVSSTQSVFGGGSLSLDGSSYLSLPVSTDWDLTATDATVEAWIYPMMYTGCTGPYAGTCQQGIIGQSNGSGDGDWNFFISEQTPFGTAGVRPYGLYAGLGGTDTFSVYTGGPTLTAMYNRWNHIAFSKANGRTGLFVNGKLITSAAVNPFSGSSRPLTIGANATAIGTGLSTTFHGYINDLRITKGVGRYISDFTPPTAPFQDPLTKATPPPPNPTNTWAPLVQGANVPGPRGYHTAVWTGSKMIVWGGDGSPTAPLAYDPAAKTWNQTALSTVGAPSSRYGHTAIWTGQKMIIWGGADYDPTQPAGTGPRHNDGAAYDPATDTWSPIAASPLSPRFLSSAVWTGTKMIVWGGALDQIRESPATDAAMYDPATNTWSMISMTGSPQGRFLHSAVWTGDKMLIWGGTLNGVGNFNDMAAYNPANNTWTTITAANTPSARGQHATVWTGSKMIVWTGYSAPAATALNGYINEAYAYDPALNSWSSLSVTGAPLARRETSAVWTGNAMIVWSGIAAANLAAADPGMKMNDGGVYYP